MRGRPRWVVIVLGFIIVFEALLSSWDLGRASYTWYYVDAARSMSLSLRALMFGAFDPGGSVTLDKLSGFLLPQVLSIRLFGFHPWSTMLPQVVEGMVTVLACYVVAARWKGAAAGLLAAAAAATTPLLSAMFGRGSEDAMITMALAVALWCWQSAVMSGRLLPLLGSCAWVAVGFQAKMLQAWFIVPALGIGYLMAAPNPIRQRLRRALLAGALTAGLSLVWVAAMMLIPAADRPYFDGSTNNNGLTMVFGYNGLNRIIPNLIGGAVGDTAPTGHSSTARLPIPPPGTPGLTAHAVPSVAPAPPDHHVTLTGKLLSANYLTQVGWLYPSATAGALLNLAPALTAASRRRRNRRAASPPGRATSPPWGAAGGRLLEQPSPSDGPADPSPVQPTGIVPPGPSRTVELASLGMTAALTLWLLIDIIFLSAAAIPHLTYLSALTVQISVLAAAGLVKAWQLRRSPSLWLRWTMLTLVVSQTAWTLHVLLGSHVAPAFLSPIVLAVGAAAAGVSLPFLFIADRLRWPAVAVVAVSTLLAPAVWASFNITTTVGQYGDAYGGPAQDRGRAALGPGGQTFDVTNPFSFRPDPQLKTAQQELIRYLQARTTGRGPLMAVDSWRAAEPYILYAGLDVLPMGGYRGSVPVPSLQQFQQLINTGALRFVLLKSPTKPITNRYPAILGVIGISPQTTPTNPRAWTTTHCSVVPPAEYLTTGNRLPNQTLYACPGSDRQP